MRDGEGRDDDGERAKTAKWNHQAEQEQQVIDTAEDMEEAVHDEPRRGLEPARVEPDETRVAVELEGALDLVCRARPSDVPDRNRSTVTDRRPAVSKRVEIESRESGEVTGYSSSTSTNAWFATSSTSAGRGAPVTCASARS